MTIQIKTLSGRVLYTAKNATDVRTAVEEAVKRDAYLGDAYLGDANLGDAYLRGAYLRGANLGGAYLRDANLGDAYLRDANLGDANLGDANLGDANLGGANLRGAYLRGAYLRDANLRGAYLRDANLRGAYLRDANLGDANLGDANLRDANLRDANLRDANLGGANLRDAKGLNPYVTTPLHMLADQPGPVRAYKLVTADGEGPQFGGIIYREGESYEVADANDDPTVACAAGLNVASLDWCINNWRDGYRVLLVEFDPSDIAAIPHGSDGKFRVRRLTVVGEKDLAEIGLGDA